MIREDIQCPTCHGRGWIRGYPDSVPRAEFDCIKSVALSSMETSETLMNECTKRADRIKELETSLERTINGEHFADKEIERLLAKIGELEAYHDRVRGVHQAREMEFATVCERYKIDLELLDEMMKVVNPLIKSGAYAKPSTDSRSLAIHMYGLCQTVVQYRRKHGIVG